MKPKKSRKNPDAAPAGGAASRPEREDEDTEAVSPDAGIVEAEWEDGKVGGSGDGPPSELFPGPGSGRA
jgi:hypothetical protein